MANIQVFEYQNNKVRTVDVDGEAWFVLKDVCEVLHLGTTAKVAERLDDDEFKREQATRRFVENGCTPEDAEKIAKFIQFLDQCFSEHNERALRKASEVDGD